MASRTKRLELFTQLARTVRGNIERATPIRQFGRLRKSFRFIVTGNGVIIYSIYYWARFANFGRRAIDLQNTNRTMLFFEDPDDDPRVSDDYPRKRGLRKLTSAELRQAREEGKLIAAKAVAAAAPIGFIEKGIRQARQEVPKKMLERIQGDVRRLIRRRKDSVTVRL